MPDSSPNDHTTDDRQPGSPTSPLFVGVTLWRESVVASVGFLALLTGIHGWLYVLDGGLGAGEYTPLTLAGDVAYVFAGTFLVVAAAGSAQRRVSGD